MVAIGDNIVVQYYHDLLTPVPSTQSTRPVNLTPASPVETLPMSNSSMCTHVVAMHNYTAAPSCLSTTSKHGQMNHSGPPPKQIQSSNTDSYLKSVVHKLQSGHSHSYHNHRCRKSSSQSSKGRRSHINVLEQKRRNNLKSRFHELRDHIPELNSLQRVPKVVILEKATEYIWSLRGTQSKLKSKLKHIQRKNKKLKSQLAQIHGSSFII